MPNDYYNDEADEGPTGGMEEAAPQGDDEGSEQKTALIPSSLCPGMEVGDEVVLRIESIRDGEYEVSYPREPGERKRERQGQRPSMEGAMKHNRSMSSFMED